MSDLIGAFEDLGYDLLGLDKIIYLPGEFEQEAKRCHQCSYCEILCCTNVGG